jgi:hypothetical protein
MEPRHRLAHTQLASAALRHKLRDPYIVMRSPHRQHRDSQPREWGNTRVDRRPRSRHMVEIRVIRRNLGGHVPPDQPGTGELERRAANRILFKQRQQHQGKSEHDKNSPPVCLARLSSIIRSKMVLALTKVSFMDTRSAWDTLEAPITERTVTYPSSDYTCQST